MRYIISFITIILFFSIVAKGQSYGYQQKNLSVENISDTNDLSTSVILQLEEGIFQIPSILDKKNLDKLITVVHRYLVTNSLYAVEIYIKDEDLRAARITKDLIIDRLRRRGWKKNDYIILYGMR